MRSTPIGIDVGARTVAALQLDRSGRVAAAAVIERTVTGEAKVEFSAEEAARLESVLFRQGFSGADVALCVPDAKLMSAVLELPPRASGAPIEQLARVELARTCKRDPGSFEMACWDIPRPTRGGEASHLMVAGCAHADADPLIGAFEAGGFRVVCLDVRPWVMARACAPILKGGGGGTRALLDLGESAAALTLVHGGVPVYERLVREAGLAALRQRLRSELGLDGGGADLLLDGHATEANHGDAIKSAGRLLEEHAQALATEVRGALDYAAHRYPGDGQTLALLGAGALLPGLAERLGAVLGVATATASPASLVGCPDALAGLCSRPALVGALGLAQFGRAA